MPDPSQSREEIEASFFIDLAREINKECGTRQKDDGSLQEYSGYSVNNDRLESAVASVFHVVYGQSLYQSFYDRAAALLVNIAKGHPFADGNKRTGLHLALTYLDAYEISLSPNNDKEVVKFVEDIVTSPAEKEQIIKKTSLQFKVWTAPNIAAPAQRPGPTHDN